MGGVLHHRHNQPIVQGHGDADMGLFVQLDAVHAPRGVDQRLPPQRPGAHLHQHGRYRHLHPVAPFIQAAAQVGYGRHVRRHRKGNVRDGLVAPRQPFGNRPPHRAHRLHRFLFDHRTNDIFCLHPAMWTAAIHGRQVHPLRPR